MKTGRAWSALAGLILMVIPVAEGQEKQDRRTEPMTLEQLPSTVKAVVLKETEGAKVKTILRIAAAGKASYLIAAFGEGKAISLLVDGQGKLVVRNSRGVVDIGDLPKAVKATIEKEAREGDIEEITEVRDNDKIHYEATVTVNDEEIELRVNAEGKLVSKRVIEDEPDETEDEQEEPDEDAPK